MQLMKPPVAVVVAAVFCAALAGCESLPPYLPGSAQPHGPGDPLVYTTIKPISPHNLFGLFIPFVPVVVDSLQPVFKWQAASPGLTADLAIWEAVKSHPGGNYDIRGRLVYHKEGLTGEEHRLDKPLDPDTTYFWSIKPTGTTAWATATFQNQTIGILPGSSSGSQTISGCFFLIQTPKD
jgi:hypothetical protein